LTNRPNADKYLTGTMANQDHGKGPVFRTLREIAALPEAERHDAFVDRLDLLDQDEVSKVGSSKSGREYSMTSNTVRLSILEVGKAWLVDMQADKKPAGKLAALRMFDAAPKKAAG
jgi:hypothetical protein